jgi:PAS domain-containing protein
VILDGDLVVSAPGRDARANEQLLRRLTEALPLGIVQMDEHRRVVFRNDRLAEVLGRADADTLDEHFLDVAAADRGSLDAALTAVLGRAESAELELTLKREGGAASSCAR